MKRKGFVLGLKVIMGIIIGLICLGLIIVLFLKFSASTTSGLCGMGQAFIDALPIDTGYQFCS